MKSDLMVSLKIISFGDPTTNVEMEVLPNAGHGLDLVTFKFTSNGKDIYLTADGKEVEEGEYFNMSKRQVLFLINHLTLLCNDMEDEE